MLKYLNQYLKIVLKDKIKVKILKHDVSGPEPENQL
jgi:hypothetical protein